MQLKHLNEALSLLLVNSTLQGLMNYQATVPLSEDDIYLFTDDRDVHFLSLD